jgi:hypothetical protein
LKYIRHMEIPTIMKKLLSLILFFAIAGISAHAQTSEGPKNGPIIVFSENSFDFGDITQGDTVKHIFNFKNTGTAPLILSEVITTCGCTAPKWTNQPILPGKTGEIAITYDSKGKEGVQNKVITVLSNSVNTPVRVSIRVNVLPKK